jgi:hypothetical protein
MSEKKKSSKSSSTKKSSSKTSKSTSKSSMILDTDDYDGGYGQDDRPIEKKATDGWEVLTPKVFCYPFLFYSILMKSEITR